MGAVPVVLYLLEYISALLALSNREKVATSRRKKMNRKSYCFATDFVLYLQVSRREVPFA